MGGRKLPCKRLLLAPLRSAAIAWCSQRSTDGAGPEEGFAESVKPLQLEIVGKQGHEQHAEMCEAVLPPAKAVPGGGVAKLRLARLP